MMPVSLVGAPLVGGEPDIRLFSKFGARWYDTMAGS